MRAENWPEALKAGREAVFPPDPGWLRLRQAARATLAGMITMLIVNLLGAERGVSGPTELFGFAMGLFGAASLHDPTQAAQRVTILLQPLPAVFGSVLAGLVEPFPGLGQAVFVAVLASVVYEAGRGPRPGSLATVGMMAYLFGLIGKVHLADVPVRAAIALLASLVVLFVHSVVLPERPERVMARIEAHVRAGARAVLAILEQAVRVGTWQRRARRRVVQAILRLDEVVIVARAAVAGEAGGQSHVLGLESLSLALERVAWKILARLPDETERPAIAAAIAELREGSELGDARGGALAGQAVFPALKELGRALGGTLPVEDEVPTLDIRLPAKPAGPPALRRVAQAVLAIGIAVLLGGIILPGRWYWAAFAAFVVFLGTRSRGESIAKALQFLAGTIAGVVGGTLIATALSGHPYVSLVCIIIAVFLAFQASTAAYEVMMFWITVLLGLLFGLLGYFTPDLLLTRLIETAIGSASGVAIAAVVWAIPTRDAVAEAAHAYFAVFASLVETAGRSLASGARDPGLLLLSLALEERFVNLGAAERPRELGPLAGATIRRRWRLWMLMACHYRVRELTHLADKVSAPVRTESATEITTASARVVAAARQLAGEPHEASPPRFLVPKDAEDPLVEAALLLLRRIDALLRRIAE
ncbi:MAG TPA: FUSC family protein [Acetobacteraceae bacterium]|nr:FUSC family protein [Acetobacteraceae bacterium]